MNLNNFKASLDKLRPWVNILAIGWLLASIGLSSVVNSLLIIFALLLIIPILAFFGFRWWLKSNLVTDKCPVCGFESTSINNTQFQCPNCGEQLLVKNNQFSRFVPEGTIDVAAVEIPGKSLEE